MEKIRLNRAVVVEGKYDKNVLSQLIDGVIITTDGFGVFSDPDTVRLIQFYAEKTGIVVLTDPDTAGQQIRGRVKGLVDPDKIINLYCPVIFGKEKRKDRPSKEGKLGVEGMSAEVLRKVFADAGLIEGEPQEREPVTKQDMIMLGLSGGPDSARKRETLCLHLGLPDKLSAAALRDAVSTLFGRSGFISYYQAYAGGQAHIGQEENDDKP
ncbi:MAG: DUF4093 domain-containing protein [Ruminococcus sp.]|nr:DUF4093 domain-containing protein [Ruminococcus sp.]